jgi:hypothetical protein
LALIILFKKNLAFFSDECSTLLLNYVFTIFRTTTNCKKAAISLAAFFMPAGCPYFQKTKKAIR